MIIRNCFASCKEILAILIFYLGADLAISAFSLYQIPGGLVPAGIIQMAKAGIISVFLIRRGYGFSGEEPEPGRRSAVSIATATAAGLGALFMLNFLSGLIPGAGAPSLQPAEAGTETVAMFILVVAAVVAEELMFRAFLIPALQRAGASRTAALIGAALLFAAGHGYLGAPGLLFAFCSALLLGGMYLYFRLMWPVVLIHLAYNLTILIGNSYI